jgi:hypothetical protein
VTDPVSVAVAITVAVTLAVTERLTVSVGDAVIVDVAAALGVIDPATLPADVVVMEGEAVDVEPTVTDCVAVAMDVGTADGLTSSSKRSR